VHVDEAQHLVGTIADVRIERALPNSLGGVLADAPAPQMKAAR
jgi:hypothetical protein